MEFFANDVKWEEHSIVNRLAGISCREELLSPWIRVFLNILYFEDNWLALDEEYNYMVGVDICISPCQECERGWMITPAIVHYASHISREAYSIYLDYVELWWTIEI